MDKPAPNNQPDQWKSLKEYTSARIVLGRNGTSIPLKESLAFQMAHAHARDAVYSHLDIEKLKVEVEALPQQVICVSSKVENREQYLKRPDLGKFLNDASAKKLDEINDSGSEVVIILADGLSSSAVNKHAVPLLKELLPKLQDAHKTVAPIIISEQSRVALADDIGERLNAGLSLILIGERPGLSSPESLGAYLTYKPKKGLTDESRNCISNIRPNGLVYPAAADKIFYIIQEAFSKKISGVKLKDNMGNLNA
ncbi:ethanolamine ammonia-lyase subunit EutC [Fulvivirga sediminis]|uniref:Ethanolamine ammonia-lyase small subunit n=1 Tax=Fulvivirga sediminis TaxID=2803949 RepID=A0A937F857_9BACT|nr:ethanolamine ammonia-lyase subunit EutC [Fulvivirga sediminis]MBL3656059.1 ethanolamine ammonia-lyase subunit EutC [Fulvivirga sediminis]